MNITPCVSFFVPVVQVKVHGMSAADGMVDDGHHTPLVATIGHHPSSRRSASEHGRSIYRKPRSGRRSSVGTVQFSTEDEVSLIPSRPRRRSKVCLRSLVCHTTS